MAYTNPYNVEDKEDSAEKTAYAAGKPTKHFLFGLEFNGIKSAFATITGWINSLLSSKEDKVSAVIAFGLDNYTATIPELTELLEGYKMLFLFENTNTGASTLKINDFDPIEIVKEGDVQLISNDLIGVHWLMYDGVKFQVVGHVPKQFPLSVNEIAAINGSNSPSAANPVATIEDLDGIGGGSETFSILFAPDGQYGEWGPPFSTIDQFKVSNGYCFQNAMWSINSSSSSVDNIAPGIVIPYDCVLIKAVSRIGYSDGGPRDLRIFAQRGDSGSAPGFFNENLNRVTLIDTRINEGITGYSSQNVTVNNIPIIDSNFVITANSVFKHMIAAKAVCGAVNISIQYFFKRV